MTVASRPAWRRWLGPILVAAGLGVLTMNETRLERVDTGALLFVGLTSTGAFVWARRRTALRWLVASLPFWAVANASGPMMAGALILTMAWLVSATLGPVLPGRRRRRGGTPLPHLANGPLVPVTARAFSGGQRSRVLAIATWILTALAVVLAFSSAASPDPAVSGALAVACAIMAATFAFGNWFADRMRLRVDGAGLHSRVLFREHTVPWPEVTDVYLRYVFLGMGGGVRLVYYCVASTTREFAFPSSMAGASDLTRTIEEATGLTFPAPEFEATF